MTHRPLSDREMELPWYRYFSLSNTDGLLPYALKNLRDNSLFFQSPAKFNDLYDCKVIINPCTYEQWEAGLRKVVEKEYSGHPSHIIDQAFNEQKIIGSPERAYTRYKNIVARSFENYGVCCLTSNPVDMLMWAHYGERHMGICFEINVKLCLQHLWDRGVRTDLGFVRYVPRIPEIDFMDSFLSEDKNFALKQVQEIVFSKWELWHNENEIRVAISRINEQIGTRIVQFPKNIFKSVILGTNADSEMVTHTKTILRERGDSLPLFRICPNETVYRLEIHRIEY